MPGAGSARGRWWPGLGDRRTRRSRDGARGNPVAWGELASTTRRRRWGPTPGRVAWERTSNTAAFGEQTVAEGQNVARAVEEQAAELNEVSARAEELTHYAQYLGDGLDNFETEEEHEFVFQTGAGEPAAGTADDDPEESGSGDDDGETDE